jgi:hypothetical protein
MAWSDPEGRTFESAPQRLVRQYRREIKRILEVLGHPEAFVTDASVLSDFPLREEPSTPTVTELANELGIRVEPQHRLVDIARRMRQLADRQITAGTPEARHAWVDWLGDRDTAALLLTLMQAIDKETPPEALRQMVDGWRTNALQALAANDYRASVDGYLEVSADARLYLLARPALRRHLEDLEDADDDACSQS